MSRSKIRSKYRNSKNSAISQRSLIRPDLIDTTVSSERIADPVTDARLWSPSRIKPRVTVPTIDLLHPVRNIRKVLRKKMFPRGYDYLNPAHWVIAPRRTLVCARRRIRREVIMALHLINSSGGRGKRRMRKNISSKRHYNTDSLIKCRR